VPMQKSAFAITMPVVMLSLISGLREETEHCDVDASDIACIIGDMCYRGCDCCWHPLRGFGGLLPPSRFPKGGSPWAYAATSLLFGHQQMLESLGLRNSKLSIENCTRDEPLPQLPPHLPQHPASRGPTCRSRLAPALAPGPSRSAGTPRAPASRGRP